MKCQKCTKAATLHITEIVSEDQVEELHLCEECAHRYLYEPQQKGGASKPAPASGSDEAEEPGVLNRECEVCGIKFVDFRNSHRLGCARDYQVFQTELMPLLENIHGETRHVGKVPKFCASGAEQQTQLIRLRREMKEAITAEEYEQASKLRDEIRTIEQARDKDKE